MDEDYRTLGLMPGASKETVKRAYRRLAHANHPDRFPDPEKKREQESRMAAINEAYRRIVESGSAAVPSAPVKKPEASDFVLYRRGADLFDRTGGSLSVDDWRPGKADFEVLEEKLARLNEACECFRQLLRYYPDSDWAADSRERLSAAGKRIAKLERAVEEEKSTVIAWTKKGTPYRKPR
jgi:hypothetical protein